MFCLSYSGQFFHQTHMLNGFIENPRKNLDAFGITSGLSSKIPQICTAQGKGKCYKILDVTDPPPKASKNKSYLCSLCNCLYCFSQLPQVTITQVAPQLLSISACSLLLTILIKGILQEIQILLSWRPRAEAAAVLMIPWCDFTRQMQIIASTVSGLMMPAAALMVSTSSEITKYIEVAEYSAQLPEEAMKHTRLPLKGSSSCEPTLTILPTPSYPGVTGGTFLVNRPHMNMWSTGFIVLASTLTRTSDLLSTGKDLGPQQGVQPNLSIMTAIISYVYIINFYYTKFSMDYFRFLKKYHIRVLSLIPNEWNTRSILSTSAFLKRQSYLLSLYNSVLKAFSGPR